MYSTDRRFSSPECRWLPCCATTFFSFAFFARWRASCTDPQSGVCTEAGLPARTVARGRRVRRERRVPVSRRVADHRVVVLLLFEPLGVLLILLHPRHLLADES